MTFFENLKNIGNIQNGAKAGQSTQSNPFEHESINSIFSEREKPQFGEDGKPTYIPTEKPIDWTGETKCGDNMFLLS